jgi:hypothetical protein
MMQQQRKLRNLTKRINRTHHIKKLEKPCGNWRFPQDFSSFFEQDAKG